MVAGEIACRCPITRTDLASPIVAVPTFELPACEGGSHPLERVPVSPRRATATAIGGGYPPPVRYAPPTLLLFRVISTFRYPLCKRDFEAARDRSRPAQERLSITGFDFACSLQRCNYI